jgi:hypothetical protein
MKGSVTNHQHYQAHKLVIEYQRIHLIEDSAERLKQFTIWQSKMQKYGGVIELKKVS